MQSVVLQIIAALFAVFALSRVYLRFKEHKLSSFAFIFWLAIWVLGMLFVFVPQLATKVAQFVGIGRGSDAVVYASIAVIFYLVFRVYIMVEDARKQITELTRIIALLNSSKKSVSRKK